MLSYHTVLYPIVLYDIVSHLVVTALVTAILYLIQSLSPRTREAVLEAKL